MGALLGPECRFLLAGFGNDTTPPPLGIAEAELLPSSLGNLHRSHCQACGFLFLVWGVLGAGWLGPVWRYLCPSLGGEVFPCVACPVTAAFFTCDKRVGSGAPGSGVGHSREHSVVAVSPFQRGELCTGVRSGWEVMWFWCGVVVPGVGDRVGKLSQGG